MYRPFTQRCARVLGSGTVTVDVAGAAAMNLLLWALHKRFEGFRSLCYIRASFRRRRRRKTLRTTPTSSFLSYSTYSVFVFRGEQIKRLLYTPLQTGVSTSRFSVRLVNPSRIVFGRLDEVVRVVVVFAPGVNPSSVSVRSGWFLSRTRRNRCIRRLLSQPSLTPYLSCAKIVLASVTRRTTAYSSERLFGTC